MFKEGWCVGLGQEGLHEGGGIYLKYFKRGWNRKERRGSKGFIKVGGALKWVGAGTPLQAMDY